MSKLLKGSKAVGAGAAVVAFSVSCGSALAFTQTANIKVLPTTGSGVPQGGKNVLLDSYLATRDPDSTRGTKKTNPVGTVSMRFPAGSSVNAAAVGAGNVCQLSEYAAVSTLKTSCSKAVVGRGWAFLNSGNPSPQPQIDQAPAACPVGDATQYSRTWAAHPEQGPDCVPIGSVYVDITAYQGGVLGSKYWCYGTDWSTMPADSFKGKKCTFLDANGKRPNISISGKDAKGKDTPNSAYRPANNGCNMIFANNNGIAPLAFGGAVSGCGSVLSVVIPSLNGTGAGLGELTGGLVLSDFYLKVANKSYLKAGSCPRGRYSVTTRFTYSKLKGEASLPASNPASRDVVFSGSCKK